MSLSSINHLHQTIDAEAIERKVKQLVAEEAGMKPEEIKNGMHLIDDLCLDSLDLIELVMTVEEEFPPIRITDKEAEKLPTVQHVIDYVKANAK